MQESSPIAGKRLFRYSDLVTAGYVSNRETLRRWMRDDRFPKPIYPESNSPRWIADELLAWEQALANQRSVSM